LKKKLTFISLLISAFAAAQTNLLLNGGFEDVNTCTEYNSECGVEGWFYLKDVKAQMLENDSNKLTGHNTFGLYFNWLEYTNFSPLIGTILPCALQKGKQYRFTGLVSATLNAKLNFKVGVCLGERFYVPNRPFAKNMQPETINNLTAVLKSSFYKFEHTFIATGNEKYLTFGTYVEQDTVVDKMKKLTGIQTVSVQLDNFSLTPLDENEIACPAYEANGQLIYNYNFRHKEMDYSLYGKGYLSIVFNKKDSNFITRQKEPEPIVIKDTLKLGDVFFDFNKADLKPAATTILAKYFLDKSQANTIDSIYIEGHTDSIGSDKKNLELSLQRCEAVKNWLTMNSVTATEILFVHPFGKSRPIATNSSTAGRALNRRVELIVFRKREKQP
jgi:outer membrane protein OmpA-like peptidoglycan-associated protein